MGDVDWIAAVLGAAVLWGCWALTDKVTEFIERFEIRGDGVGLIWVIVGSPVIAGGVYDCVASF